MSQTDSDEIWNLILAGIAAFGTLLTAFVIFRESRQQQINERFQLLIMKDLIRHLYRNKIVIRAITLKLSENGYENFYPSEEHLLKLKVLPEDIRISRFNTTTDHYDILHEFELKFRNFNTEVDVALEHLKQQSLKNGIKERDLDVLEFKSEYLTSEIMKLMEKLEFDFNQNNLIKYLKEISCQYVKPKIKRLESEHSKLEEGFNEKKYLNSISYKTNPNRSYYERIGLKDEVKKEARLEKSVINLIEFPSN